jgi:hypothetical protein
VSEVLFVGHMMNTIEKVYKMLTEPKESIPKFDFIPARPNYNRMWFRSVKASQEQDCTTHCYKCHKEYEPDEMIPVKTSDFKWHYYCPDCIVDNVEWCCCCGEAFETDSVGMKMNLCEDCYYDFYYQT